MLAALGSMPRMAVFRALLRAGASGRTIGELQSDVNMPASTMKHHLMSLLEVGLVDQHRVGREVLCYAKFDDIRRLSAFLLHECCADNVTAGQVRSSMRRAA